MALNNRKTDFSDYTSSTSESENEDVLTMFGPPSDNSHIVSFNLEDGLKYEVNVKSTNLDICGKTKGVSFTSNDIINILTSLKDYDDYVHSLKNLQIITPVMDDKCCNIMIDVLECLEFHCLNSFAMYGPTMEPLTFRRLMNFIAHGSSGHIEEFTLGRVFIGDELFGRVLRELDLGRLESVRIILLPEIGLTDKSRDVIIGYLKSDRSKNLKLVSFADNTFSDEVKADIMEAAKCRQDLMMIL